MSLFDRALAFRRWVLGIVEKLKWMGPLLARITLGYVFLKSGWGKLHNLDGVTEFFASLNLPAPHFQATLVACTEFVGGLLILIGLGARLAALPLATTMVVAILTAKKDDIASLNDLFGVNEFLYLVLFLWIAFAGAGALSIDRLLARQIDARPKKPLLRPVPSTEKPADKGQVSA